MQQGKLLLQRREFAEVVRVCRVGLLSRPALVDEVPAGRMHMDGRILVGEGEGLAKDRRAMAFAGLLVVTLVVDHKGRIAAPPVVLGEGMPDPVEEAVLKAVEDTLDKNKRSDPDELAVTEIDEVGSGRGLVRTDRIRACVDEKVAVGAVV